MRNPLVSVIIPNYCHAKYLDQRIQSVLNQTYQNFEVIILDDASPDNGASISVIEKYRNNPHISHIIYNDENSGSTFKQWNKGFELAKGELIWIAESDDFCENNLLSTLVPEFEEDEDCVLAFVGSLWVDSKGNPLRNRKNNNDIERLNGRPFVKKHLRFGNDIQNASSAVFKRKIALFVDSEYSKYKGCGDLLFWIEISLKGNVVFAHEQLNYFRFHATNTTKQLYANGRNLTELHNIYKYQITHKLFTSIWNRFYTRHCYISWIDEKISDPKIRAEVHKLWDPYHTDWVVELLIHLKYLPNNIKRRIIRK